MIDLNMPNMDGLALARRIRAEWHQTTKLVMVTGADVHAACYRDALEDFDQVIEKPVTAARLTDVLGELQGKVALSNVLPTGTTTALDGLHILVAEDVPTNQLIMRDLLESSVHQSSWRAMVPRPFNSLPKLAKNRSHPHGYPDADHGWPGSNPSHPEWPDPQ